MANNQQKPMNPGNPANPGYNREKEPGNGGGAAGTMGGAKAGNREGEAFDPKVETEYWRNEFPERPYYNPEFTYEQFEPAFRFGWESRERFNGRNWNEVEGDLERDWAKRDDRNGLDWKTARDAARDSWDRVENFHLTDRQRLRR